MLVEACKARDLYMLREAIWAAEEAEVDPHDIYGPRAVLMEAEILDALLHGEDEGDDPLESMMKSVDYAEAKGVHGPRRLRGVQQMIHEAEAVSANWCECCLAKVQDALERATPVMKKLEYQVNKEQASIKLTNAVNGDCIVEVED